MADQFFHLNNRLRENRLKVIQEAQKLRLENEEPKSLHGFDSVESLRKATFDSYDRIAPILNANFAMQNQRSKDSSILQGAQRIKSRNMVTDAVDTKRDLYFDLTHNIVDAFSGNKQSGHAFMLKSVDMNKSFSYAFNEHAKTSSGFSAVERSINYLKENNHGIMAFDLEIFGGKNNHGKQTLDKITEFSFLTYDSIDAKSASKTVTGYVGITSAGEERKYRSILDKFKSNPMSLTSLEEITLKSFAKLGSGGLDVAEDANVAGRFIVKNGMSERDIRMTADNIESGIKRAREIGERQRQTSLANGMMQWEKDLSDAIVDMQTSKKSIVGHNIINADIPWLNQYLSGARKSVKDYIRAKGGSTSFNIGRHRIADTLPLMQHAMANDKFRNDYLDPKTRSMLSQYGLSPNTLEALSNRNLEADELERRMGIGSKAHTSIFDAQQTFEVMQKQVGTKNLVDYALSAGREMNEGNVFGHVKGDGSQLFYAARALGGNQDGIMGFKVDPFDGQFYTMDGYTVNPNQPGKNMPSSEHVKYNRGFSEYLTKKGMSYTVEGIVGLESIEKHGSQGNEHLGRYIEEMKKAHPALAVNDLVAVKMKSVSEYNGQSVLKGSAAAAPKNEAVSYIVAPMKEVQNFFNNNMVMYAEKGKNGQFQLKKGAQRLLEGSSLIEGEKGLELIGSQGSGNLIKDTIESGARANIDDAAGRIIRDMDFDKFKRFNEFSNMINLEAEAMSGPELPEEKRRRAIQLAIENGRSVAQKIANNIPLAQTEQAGSLGLIHEVLGYEDFMGRQVLHPGRVNNAVAMVDYFTSMKPITESILSEINRIDSSADKKMNDMEKKYLFRQAMDVAISGIEQFNNKQADVKDVMLRQIDKNYFEIPMVDNSKRGTPLSRMAINNLQGDILRVNLNNGEGSLLNKIVDDKYKGDHTEQKKRLFMLMESTGVTKNILGKQSGRDYLDNNTPYVIARDFIDQLKQIREKDPSAGYITPPRTQTVTAVPDIVRAMSDDRFDYKNVVKQSINAIKNHKAGTIIDIRGISKAGSESQLNKVANDIVTNILMDKFNKDEFKKYGYNDQQIDWMSKTREIRERDYTSMVKEILKGVSATDMSLHFDRGTGLFAIQDGDRMIDLSDMPRERITDGIVYTQVGRNRVGSMTHLDVDMPHTASEAAPSHVKLKSDIGMAMKNVWPLEASVVNQQKRGIDPINVIQGYISRIASELREGSSVQRLDEQDSKAMFHLGEKEFVNNLKRMPGIDNVKFGAQENEISLEEKKYFLKQINDPGFEYDRMNDSMKGIYVKYRRDIMEHVFSQVGVTNEVSEVLDVMSNRAKAGLAADGAIKILNSQYEMESFNNPNRLFETSARYLGFRQDETLKRLDELSTESNKLKDKVYLGANLRTSVGMTYASRNIDSLDTVVHTEAIVKRAYVGAEEFKRRVYNAATTADEKWASERLRESGNLYEGGAVASSRLGDAIFQTYDHQRVSFSRKLFDDHQFSLDNIKEMQKYSEVVPEISIKDNGEIDFKYRKGKYYKQGSTFLTEIAYGDSENKIATKNDGVLRLGFFTKSFGVLANEDEVKKNVVAYARDKGLTVADENAFMKIAGEIYDTNFYIDRVKEVTYRKIHEDRAEKGMTAFTYTGLGDSRNEKIAKVLDDTGLSELKGTALRKEFFDELRTGNVEGGIISQMSSKEGLTNRQLQEAVKRAGYENVEKFGEDILTERHFMSDFMSKQFDGALYLSNTADAKHKNISRPISMMVNEMFVNEVQGGLSEGDAAKAVRDSLRGVFHGTGGQGLEVINGRLATPQMDFLDGSHINFDELKKVYSQKTGKDINDVFNQFGINPEKQTGVGYSTISLADDHTSITGAINLGLTKRDKALDSLQKGFKITDREISHFQMAKIHDDFIKSSQAFLDDQTFRSAYGFMVDFDEKGKAALKDEFRHTAFLDPFVQTVKKDLFAQNGDKLLIENGEVVKMISGNQVGERIEYQPVQSLDELSEETRRLVKTAQGAAQASGGNVSIKAAQQLYSSASTTFATRFNLGEISEAKLRANKDFGFKDFDLRTIDFTSGGDADYFSSRNPVANAIYNQNAIIDLSSIDESILREANVGNKIAIGAISAEAIGDNIMQDDVHKRLKDVQYSAGVIAGMRNQSANFEERDYERHRNIVKTGLQDINALMSKFVTAKQGSIKQASEIRLENSAIGKASLMTLEDLANSPHNELEILKNAKFDGKSILDHHKSGVLMDFDIVSKDFVQKMGLFEDDYIREVLGDGGTKAQMEELLRSGVQVMTHRNPTIYEGSIKTATMILSDNTYGNEVISYAAGAMSAKKDADGDQTKVTLLQARDAEGKKMDSIKFKYLQQNESPIDANVERSFNLYKASAYRHATEINPYFAGEIKDDMASIARLESDAADKIIAARSMTSGIVRPELTHLPSSELREQYHNDFLRVEERARDMFTAGGNKAEDFVDSKLYKNYMERAVEEIDGDAFKHYGGGQAGFAVDYYLRDMSFIASQMGSNKQASAGEINLPLYKVRKMREMTAEAFADDPNRRQSARILEHMLEAAEEAFLSPKHNEATIIDNSMVIEEFNSAFRKATGTSRDGKGIDDLVGWFEKNLPGRYKAEKPLMDIGQNTLGSLSLDEQRVYYRQGAEMIQDMFSQYKNIDRLNTYLSTVGQTRNGVRPDMLKDALVSTGRSDTLLDASMNAIYNAHGEDVVKSVKLLNHEDLLASNKGSIALDDWTPPTSAGLKETTMSIFESAKNAIAKSGLKGKDLAFGALGIAGATMMMGFVGGNPSQKSATTAAASAEGDLYDIPIMTDNATALMQANPNQGYVININASTPKGQRHAEEAIRQAMTAGYNSTNVNVAMNINNSGGNITDSTIERMIEGMLG